MISLKTIKQRGMELHVLFIILLHLFPCFGARFCRPDQRDALLEFANSFDLNGNVWDSGCYDSDSYAKTTYWNRSVDCCYWGGVTCDDVTGNVIRLDLKCSLLLGTLHSNSTLFHLHHLQMLDLARNDFLGSRIPPEINALKELTHLNLSWGNFSGLVPSELSHLTKLRSLDVSVNFSNVRRILKLEDTTLEGITQNLTSLWVLDLSWVDMSNAMASSLTNLSSEMMYLTAQNCLLRGEFPTDIFHLPNLRHLDFNLNEITGTLPETNWTSPLVFLDLGSTRFSGRLPDSVGQLRNLKDLHLDDCGLTGILPTSLGNLTGMTSLQLSHNDLIGHIPSTLGNLNQLMVLDLQRNKLSGKVDVRLFSGMKDLQVLRLSGELSLDYESSNYSFPKLEELTLSSGNLTRFPSLIRSLDSLISLDLSGNAISGKVPSWFWNVNRNITLLSLNLSYNSLEDTFPFWLRGSMVQTLDLKANKFHGNIGPSTVGIPFSNLLYLDISNNNFQGLWPTDFFLYFEPFVVHLSDNHFHGPLPFLPPNISFFSVSNNKFTGEIPSSMCSATNLVILDLSNNSLTGTVPPCIINLSTNLSVLNLRMNKIGGIIPEILELGSGLRTLDLSRNSFEGLLPRSLQSCRHLEVLDLSNNLIEDTFPNWLATLPELQVLILRSNKFHGIMNSSDGLNPFSKLRILDLSENDFLGLLPRSYFKKLKAMMSNGKAMSYLEDSRGGMVYQDSVTLRMKGTDLELVRILSVFTSIDLSANNFWGPVPTEMGDLKSLKGLNLSRNSLTGRIPASLGNLTNLEWLDLSANKLDGTIPKQLADLTSLAVLNLSGNQLTGRIPSGKQFNTFNISSFGGNLCLCGFPLPNACSGGADPPSSSRADQETRGDQGELLSWRIDLLIGYCPGLVLGISLGYIFIQTGKPSWLASFLDKIEGKVMKMSRRKKKH